MPKLNFINSSHDPDEFLAELRDALQHPARPGDAMGVLHEAHTACLAAELRTPRRVGRATSGRVDRG